MQTINKELESKCNVEIPDVGVAFARFITGIIMHISMNTELRQSMDKMKFALNHKWKFSSWQLAFLSGFTQFLITFFVTVINYFVIIFQNQILDIVKDFLAIKVISELDDYFFVEHSGKKEISY